jgi:hypothetical protein
MTDGWHGVDWWALWKDPATMRARLDAGADPNLIGSGGLPLHSAAEYGSPEVVAELAGRVADVDAEREGRTALWLAVYARQPDNARALVAAGADPWRPMMAGWSPGRLSLAGPTPDLFAAAPGTPGLSDAEAAAAAEGARLTAALADVIYDGFSVACVAGIDAAEAARRLGGEPTEIDDEWLEDPPYDDASLAVVGVTDVPGGCIVSQPWGYRPTLQDVLTRLSKGTVCYGLYANPKSGDQGDIARDGVIEGRDLFPGGPPAEDALADEVLASYLYSGSAVGYACAYVGLRPADARPVLGPADRWLRL